MIRSTISASCAAVQQAIPVMPSETVVGKQCKRRQSSHTPVETVDTGVVVVVTVVVLVVAIVVAVVANGVSVS